MGNQFVSLDRQNLDSGVDIDGDGISERMDALQVVRVAAFEPVDVPAGHFSNAARIETQGNWKFHLSRTDEVVVEGVAQTAWLVPNVGIVREVTNLTVFGHVSTVEIILDSASVDGVVIGTPITPTPPAAQLTSMALAPSNPTLGVGTTLQLTATGNYSDGTFRDLTAQATWSSSDSTKATVSSTGLVTGVDFGPATVTATSGTVSGTTQVTVFQPTPSPVPPLSQSVAYQIDYAHSGRAVFANPVSFPSSPAWSVTLNDQISYPLIAEGKVFVTTGAPLAGSGYGTTLYALDLPTGAVAWGPVDIPGTYYWSAHAYDNGKLFVVNVDGVLRAFEANSGQPHWTIKISQPFCETPPTAVNGIVYLTGTGSGSAVYAVDQATGTILSAAGMNGANGPIVSGDAVFVSALCEDAKFDPFLKSMLWHYSNGCSGGVSSRTAAFADGKLYVPYGELSGKSMVFDAGTGGVLGTFASAGTMPALSNQAGFYLNDSGTLQAGDISLQDPTWAFAGDGGLTLAPIVINEVVVVVSTSGNVYALDATTGAQIWTGSAGAAIPGYNLGLQGPLLGLGAGEGYLIVPAGNVLTAWRVFVP